MHRQAVRALNQHVNKGKYLLFSMPEHYYSTFDMAQAMDVVQRQMPTSGEVLFFGVSTPEPCLEAFLTTSK
jgi:hypothetical protein